MKISIECLYCGLKKSENLYRQIVQDRDKGLTFVKKVMRLVSNLENNISAPFMYAKIMKLLSNELNIKDIFREHKREFNRKMLSLENEIQGRIAVSENKIIAALQYAMAGNYIDLGSMDEVKKDKLMCIIDSAENQNIDKRVFKDFEEALSNARELVYLTDNAGEIVLDKIFINNLKQYFGNLKIHVLVRGLPILNDATMEDAKYIGLDQIAHVVANGSDAPGTELEEINTHAKGILNHADIIISKGLGNFESLCGCGKNIYYILLCKCDLFVNRFGLKRFEGVFTNEKNIIEYNNRKQQ